MAVGSLVSTAKTFLGLSSSNSSSPSSPSSSSISLERHNNNVPQGLVVAVCRAASPEHVILNKRSFALGISSAFLLSFAGRAAAAPLEAEDDLQLLEKVKQDRKKRLERQGVINSSTKEEGYLQDVVYKLSEVGQAIEKNDLNAASSVLGKNSDTDWIKKANSAFLKLTSSEEEKAEVDEFNTSISKLISSVGEKDMETTKVAFVSSATAFEKWTTLTGLDGLLKGL